MHTHDSAPFTRTRVPNFSAVVASVTPSRQRGILCSSPTARTGLDPEVFVASRTASRKQSMYIFLCIAKLLPTTAVHCGRNGWRRARRTQSRLQQISTGQDKAVKKSRVDTWATLQPIDDDPDLSQLRRASSASLPTPFIVLGCCI